jgi:hypothetical protein
VAFGGGSSSSSSGGGGGSSSSSSSRNNDGTAHADFLSSPRERSLPVSAIL